MKIFNWNCNGNFKEDLAFIVKKSSKIHVDADIYVIQECENPDDSNQDYEEYREMIRNKIGDNYFWIGDLPDRGLGIFAKENYQPSLLNGFMEVETDETKANIVYEAIQKKISTFDLRRIYKVFLSCDPDKEMKILKYIVLGFKKGSAVSMLHGNPVVFDVQSIEKRISNEKERMLQFVRFSVFMCQVQLDICIEFRF